MVVAGLLALVCLLRLQVYLTRHFRRVFGPALVAATVLTLVTLVLGGNVLGQDLGHLETAKSDGFDAIVTLAKARAIGNSMQGDQSRFLLDKQRADTYEHTYLDKSQQVLYREAGNLDTYHTQVARGSDDYLGMLGLRLSGATGRPALDAYTRFQAADATFRDLVAAGRHRRGGRRPAGAGAGGVRRLRQGADGARRPAPGGLRTGRRPGRGRARRACGGCCRTRWAASACCSSPGCGLD